MRELRQSKHFTHHMKALPITLIILLTLGLLSVPLIQAKRKTVPLYGNFPLGSQCMCGHEFYFRLDNDHLFYSCPGHSLDDKIGKLVRTSQSVTVHDLKTGKKDYQFDYRSGRHDLTIFNRDGTQTGPDRIYQEICPYRKWFKAAMKYLR